MAFMMPVVKNDYDIYKSNRSRRISECSNPNACRSRKISESSKSEGRSLSTSPGSDLFAGSPAHRCAPFVISSNKFARNSNSSRTSHSSLQFPSKSSSPSPLKSNSMSTLSVFHNKLVDKLKKSLKSKEHMSNGNNLTVGSTDAARRRS